MGNEEGGRSDGGLNYGHSKPKELSHEKDWIHYATIEAIGDIQTYKDAMIPQLEEAYQRRLDFEDGFLRTEDGKLVEEAALAPVTAKYRKKVLDDFKIGKIEGVFNISIEGGLGPIYAIVSEDENKLIAKLYGGGFNSNAEIEEIVGALKIGWTEALGNQVSYLSELGFDAKSELVAIESMEIIKVKTTEEDLIFIEDFKERGFFYKNNAENIPRYDAEGLPTKETVHPRLDNLSKKERLSINQRREGPKKN